MTHQSQSFFSPSAFSSSLLSPRTGIEIPSLISEKCLSFVAAKNSPQQNRRIQHRQTAESDKNRNCSACSDINPNIDVNSVQKITESVFKVIRRLKQKGLLFFGLHFIEQSKVIIFLSEQYSALKTSPSLVILPSQLSPRRALQCRRRRHCCKPSQTKPTRSKNHLSNLLLLPSQSVIKQPPHQTPQLIIHNKKFTSRYNLQMKQLISTNCCTTQASTKLVKFQVQPPNSNANHSLVNPEANSLNLETLNYPQTEDPDNRQSLKAKP